MPRFDRDLEAPVSFKKATRYTPDHEYMIQMVVQAFAIGIVVYIALLLLCAGARWSLRWAAVGASLAILLILSINYWMQWKDERLWQLEEILGHDLDGDGWAGKPPVQEFSFQASGRTAWRAQLPAPEPVLREWATAALNGGSLAYSTWCKRFATRSNYSDGADRYRDFRQALVRSEWAVEQGTHSIMLTPRGEQVLTEWLHQNPDPTPLLDG